VVEHKTPCEDEPKAESGVGSPDVWSAWRFALPAFLIVHVVSVRPTAKVPLCTVTIRRYSKHDRSSHWPSQECKPFPSVWLYSIPDEQNRNGRCCLKQVIRPLTVGAANQVHSRVQSLHARSRVPTLPCQARQSRASGSIQPFNKSRIEHVSPTSELEQLLCLIQQTVSHFAGDLHDPLFLRSLDHCPNVEVRPHF
jgi:hypothetical protein